MKFSLLMINNHSYVHGSIRHINKSTVEEQQDPIACVCAQHKIVHILLYGYAGKAVSWDNWRSDTQDVLWLGKMNDVQETLSREQIIKSFDSILYRDWENTDNLITTNLQDTRWEM
jgi:hypothetical protein